MASLVLVGILAPVAAEAQVCFGSPNAPGQFSMQGDLTFLDAGTGYAVTSLANLDGAWGLGATLGTVDPDVGERQTVAAARILYELAFDLVDLCPVAEVEWTTFSEAEADVDVWAFPLGVSVGTIFALSPTIEVIPSGRSGLRHQRTSVAGESFTTTDFFLDAGATFSFVPFFVRGGVAVITGDRSDTAFRISAGVTF